MTVASANSSDWITFGLWILFNFAYAGMRAQGSSARIWRYVTFIFGFPGTLLSFFVVDEGSNSIYGVRIAQAGIVDSGETLAAKGDLGPDSLDAAAMPPSAKTPQRILAWFATALLCLYCVWAYFSLQQTMKSFVLLAEHAPIAMSLSTTIVIASWPMLYLLVFGGLILGAVVKECVVADKMRSLLITLTLAIAAMLVVNLSESALLGSLTQFVDRLAR